MSRFSRDSPGIKSLSRRPGQSTKKSRFGIRSANANSMWSDNRRTLEQNVKALIIWKIQSILAFPAVIFTRKWNRTKSSWRKYFLQRSMIGRMC